MITLGTEDEALSWARNCVGGLDPDDGELAEDSDSEACDLLSGIGGSLSGNASGRRDQLEPVAELDGAGNVVARFVYATKSHSPDYVIKDGVTYRILSDHLGSPRLVVNVDTGSVVQGMDFDEWGVVTLDTNPGFQPFGFAGGLLDLDTGLTRFGARDYAAAEGRWTAKDSAGLGAASGMMFVYALNNPVNLIDRTGRSAAMPYFEPYVEPVPLPPVRPMPLSPGGPQPLVYPPGSGPRPQMDDPDFGLGPTPGYGEPAGNPNGPVPAPLPTPPEGGNCTCECTRPASPDVCEETGDSRARTSLPQNDFSFQPSRAACFARCVEVEAGIANDSGAWFNYGDPGYPDWTFTPGTGTDCTATYGGL